MTAPLDPKAAEPVVRSTPFRATLGAALQRHRLRRGLTQAQLAEYADLSLKYVGEIERGEANTTLDAIEKLAAAMGWDPMDALDPVRQSPAATARTMPVRLRSRARAGRTQEGGRDANR